MANLLADAFKKAAEKTGSSELIKQVEEREKEQKRRERIKEVNEKTRTILLLPHASDNRTFSNPPQSGFVNPYTFFPIEESEKPDKKKADTVGKHSGKLACSLEVQSWSPLFIPNTSGVFTEAIDGKVHKSFDFCSLEDLSELATAGKSMPVAAPEAPFIPGSEIRGMVRSIYEQLTNSCLPIIDEKSNPIKRTPKPKIAYRMEFDAASGKWQLFDTEVFRLGKPHRDRSFSYTDETGKQRNGSEKINGERIVDYLKDEYVRHGEKGGYFDIAINPSSVNRESWGTCYVNSIGAPGFVKGSKSCRLHVTGPMVYRDKNFRHQNGKPNTYENHLALYPSINSNADNPLYSFDENSGLFKRFIRVIEAYCEKGTAKNHNDAIRFYETYRKMIRSHMTVLVYADCGSSPMYLSPSCISPESFDTTIVDLLGGHAPCKGSEFCPACRLFGAVGSEGSLGSRVRFTDAVKSIGSTVQFGDPITLAPLSSPRPSATEFYLKKPARKSGMWNFDYLICDGKKDSVPYKALEGAGLQGRKVYLHHQFNLRGHYSSEQLKKSGQNVTVRPLNSGKFSFDVYYENLSAEELANLIYAIGGFDGRLQKLGHGKPLGMGSVIVGVESCNTRSYEYDGDSSILESYGAFDEAWFIANLPNDKRAVARRKLIRFLARDLREVLEDKKDKNLSDLVSYPKPREGVISEENATFKWFKTNRGSVNNPKIKNTLNTLSVDDMLDDPFWSNIEF